MVTIFDHYSNQEHDSVETFLSRWGEHPWNDMNVPIGLSLDGTDGVRTATVVVYHPRKTHAKEVTITIESDGALERLRATFLGVAEGLYGPAASNLEHFARGDDPTRDIDEDWGGLVLYYWAPEEFIPAKETVIEE